MVLNHHPYIEHIRFGDVKWEIQRKSVLILRIEHRLQPSAPRRVHKKAAPVPNLSGLCNGHKQSTKADFEKNWTVFG
jgi:hypothetical protein